MEKRLIDANTLMQEIATECTMYDGGPLKQGVCILLDKWEVLDRIYAAPAVDAVPVIRCKDCRHWDRTRRTPSGSHFCFCTMMHTAENHYCGYGAKMRGENECSDG